MEIDPRQAAQAEQEWMKFCDANQLCVTEAGAKFKMGGGLFIVKSIGKNSLVLEKLPGTTLLTLEEFKKRSARVREEKGAAG